MGVNWLNEKIIEDGKIERSNQSTKFCFENFFRDNSSIVHSTQFRRLSFKTQVYSNPQIDYPHTRLTHSIEVMQLGRQITRFITKTKNIHSSIAQKMEDLATATCLVHDLGHPPFGHCGAEYLEKLSSQKSKGTYIFNDNKQVIRLLVGSSVRPSFGVTCSLLDAAIKKKDPKKRCYNSEQKLVELIIKNHTRTGELRHPMSYIMEAADDIAYLCADIEDAIWLGLINFKELESLLTGIPEINGAYKRTRKKIKIESNMLDQPLNLTGKLMKPLMMHTLTGFELALRGIKQETDWPKALNDFIIEHHNENEPLNFLYWSDRKNPIGDKIAKIKKDVYKKIFASKEIAHQSILAEKVIQDLWNAFEPLTNRDGYKKEYVFSILPLYVQKKIETFHKEELADGASGVQLICDYISGMSDRFAIQMWERLNNPQSLKLVA